MIGKKMKKFIYAVLAVSLVSITPANSAEKATTYASTDAAIKVLKVATESRTGYVRTKFKHWVNSDGNKNGCDARKAAIIRDESVKPTIGKACALEGGKWISAYDNMAINKAGSIDVDHYVPLAEAWDSGASAWTDEKRKVYANDLSDPRHLISVSATSNRSKSDQDPAEWMPPVKEYACTYVANWVSIKVRWSLTVDQKELDALKKYNIGCPKKAISVVPVK